MSLPRAYAFRVDLPREPGIAEAELSDLTTAANPPSEDALHIAPPKPLRTKVTRPVPGILVTGTLPPENRARFLLRVPREWNGRLVVAAASGITDETTYDLYFSDFLVSQGYAFAATDKGVRRAVIDGDTVVMPMTPESSVRRWAGRLETLAAFSRETLSRLRGRAPERTYAVGLSNGGFLARRAAEMGFVHGAVEISGVMWRADKGNLLRELPSYLRKGFPGVDEKWKPLADLYKLVYWESSLGVFISDLDPEYRGAAADYDLDARPAALAAIREFENTGDLKAPLISIAGRHDFLIPCAGHAEAYRDLVRSRGKADLHRMVFEEDAAHIDTNAEMFPFVTPLMPRAHAAFGELVAWVERAKVPA